MRAISFSSYHALQPHYPVQNEGKAALPSFFVAVLDEVYTQGPPHIPLLWYCPHLYPRLPAIAGPVPVQGLILGLDESEAYLRRDKIKILNISLEKLFCPLPIGEREQSHGELLCSDIEGGC